MKISTVIMGILIILSLCLSINSFILAKQAINKIVLNEKLSLQPNIELKTEFRLIMDLPPHFKLTNKGPVNAFQINVKFTYLRYDPSSKSIGVIFSQADWEWNIPELKINESRIFRLPESLLGKNTRSQEPVYHNVLEVKVKFANPYGRRFEAKGYYFINPQGSWVFEADNSIDSQEFYEIKEALLNIPEKTDKIYSSDLIYFSEVKR